MDAMILHLGKMARKAIDRANSFRTYRQKGARSAAGSLEALLRERDLKSRYKRGLLPPHPKVPQTSHDFAIVAMYATARSLIAGRTGPGKGTILTLHRKIARDTLRQEVRRHRDQAHAIDVLGG